MISLFFTAIWQTVLAHIWVILIPAIVVVVILHPAGALTFARSRVGTAVIAMVLAAAVGWEARAFLDRSIELRQQLQAQIAATDAERAKTAQAVAAAAEQRREAAAQRAVAEAASQNETAARAEADDLQEQVRDYEDVVDGKAANPDPAHPAGDRRAVCALSADDARRLRGIGAPRGR